ncbi:hypothetical protein ABT269_12185 [Streptomyces viridosporus]
MEPHTEGEWFWCSDLAREGAALDGVGLLRRATFQADAPRTR